MCVCGWVGVIVSLGRCGIEHDFIVIQGEGHTC